MSIFDVGTPLNNPVQSCDGSGGPPAPGKNREQITSELQAAKFRFGLWIVGALIGLLPAMAIPFVKLLGGTVKNIWDFIAATFCQSEILFMAVSLSISANHDATEHNEEGFRKLWGLFAIVLIVLGALTFALLSGLEYVEYPISHTITMWFCLILFLTTIFGCSLPYVKSMKKIKVELSQLEKNGG